MILFVSTNDILGGAALVTFRLVDTLRRQGYDARMLVARKDSHKPWVDTVDPLRFKAAKTAERARIFIANGFNRTDLWRISDASFGCGATNHPWMKEAHTVVLGWINQGLLSLADIRRLERTDKHLIWWMHDLWCATGICHVPAHECTRYHIACGNCPFLHNRAAKNDLSATTFTKKINLLNSFRISYLAVSSWQRNQCLQSPILHSKRIEILGHPLQIDQFPYHTTTESISALAQFSPQLANAIKAGKKIIVMGAARLDDPVKGLPVAIEALNQLDNHHPHASESTLAVLFGTLKDTTALNQLKFPHLHLGNTPAHILPKLYAASTVILSTSHFETMGATLMEGIAAGATAVSFATGGQADIVINGQNGYIAPYSTHETSPLALAIAQTLARALQNPFNRAEQHRSIARRFAADQIARHFISLTHAR